MVYILFNLIAAIALAISGQETLSAIAFCMIFVMEVVDTICDTVRHKNQVKGFNEHLFQLKKEDKE